MSLQVHDCRMEPRQSTEYKTNLTAGKGLRDVTPFRPKGSVRAHDTEQVVYPKHAVQWPRARERK